MPVPPSAKISSSIGKAAQKGIGLGDFYWYHISKRTALGKEGRWSVRYIIPTRLRRHSTTSTTATTTSQKQIDKKLFLLRCLYAINYVIILLLKWPARFSNSYKPIFEKMDPRILQYLKPIRELLTNLYHPTLSIKHLTITT